VSSLREIKDDTNNNKHGHSFSSSENEHEAEKNKRTENHSQSCTEALKDAIKRGLAMREITRRNENREVNRKSEASLCR
jgi:hypothetical protein